MTEKEKEEWGETVKVTATDNSDEWGETVVVSPPKSPAPSKTGGESGAFVRPITPSTSTSTSTSTPTSASVGLKSESWTKTVNPLAAKAAVQPTKPVDKTKAPEIVLGSKELQLMQNQTPDFTTKRIDKSAKGFNKTAFDQYNSTYNQYKDEANRVENIKEVLGQEYKADPLTRIAELFSDEEAAKGEKQRKEIVESQLKNNPSYSYSYKNYEKAKNSFYKSTSNVSKEIDKQLDLIASQSGGWGKFINPLGEADVDKVRNAVDDFLVNNDIDPNSPIAFKMRSEMKGKAEFKHIEPKVNSEFDAIYKSKYGVTPEEDMDKEYAAIQEKYKIEAGKLDGVKKAKADLEKKRFEGDQVLKKEFEPQQKEIDERYQLLVSETQKKVETDPELKTYAESLQKEIFLKYQDLVNKGTLTVEQAEVELSKPETMEAINKKVSEKINEKYSPVFESTFKDYQKQINNLNGRRNSLYRTQEEARVNEANKKIDKELEGLKVKFDISDDIKNKRKTAYEDAYKKVSESQFGTQVAFSRSLPFEIQAGASILSGIGGGIKSLGYMFGLNQIYNAGESLEANFALKMDEGTGSFKDWLDLDRQAITGGNIVGRMIPTAAATVITAAVTKNWALTAQIAANTAVAWTAEGIDMTASVEMEVLEKYGDPVRAKNAANSMWVSHVYDLPLSALGSVPFISGLSTKIAKKIAPSLYKETIKGGRRTFGQYLKQTAGGMLVGGASEVVSENIEEIKQGIDEEAARNGVEVKSLFDEIKILRENLSKEGIKKTIIETTPSVLFMGATPVFFSESTKYAKEKYYERGVDNYVNGLSIKEALQTSPEQYIYNTLREKGKNFTGTLINTLYTSGNIDEKEYDRLSGKLAGMDGFQSWLIKNKAEGTATENIIGYKLYEQYQDAKKEFESATDELSIDLLKDKMEKAKAEFQGLYKGEGTNAVVLTMGDGKQFVFTPEEMNFALQFENIRAGVRDKSIGVKVFTKKGQAGFTQGTLNEMKIVFEEKPLEEGKVELEKNTSSTPEKYGTINRNDGKGIIDLTQEEFEAEQAKMQQEAEKSSETMSMTQSQFDIETALINSKRREELRQNKDRLNSPTAGSKDTIEDVINAKYDAQLEELSKYKIVPNKSEQTEENAEEIDNAAEVEKLRVKEQEELNAAIPDADKYKTDGKVDRNKLTDPEDIKAFDEIYDRYDKLITPLLEKSKAEADPLKDVDSTAKALEGKNTGLIQAPLLSEIAANKIIGKSEEQTISEAYHKAKADGSNPELVKSVEELLTPKTTTNEKTKKTSTEGSMLEEPRDGGTQDEGGQESTELRTEEKEAVEGSTVKLPPSMKGGMERTMVFKDGEWQQSVGGSPTKVGDKVKAEADEAFKASQKAKPTEVITETETTPTVEAPKVESEELSNESNQELKRIEGDIAASESKIEDFKSEIEIEKGNLKEEKARIKQEKAKVRASSMSKKQKVERLEELDAELEDIINDHDDLVQQYRDDIAQEKSDIKDLKKQKAAIEKKAAPKKAPVVKRIAVAARKILDNIKSSKIFVGRDSEVSLASDDYKEKNGMSLDTPNMVFAVSEADGKRIADAYEQMKHDPDNPIVKQAFNELITEIKKQADALIARGYKFQIAREGEGYNSDSKKMFDDVRNNKRIFVDPSSKSFGTKRTFDSENIGLQDSGYKDVNGIPMTNVELIRAVHDLFGHNEFGNGFGAIGEENAWRNHMSMFTPLAQRALTSTTRGQNSWVNFGEHMRNPDGSIKKKGDKGYLSPSERPFAEQKIGLLPEWATENAYGDRVTINGKKIKPVNKYVVDGTEIYEIDDAEAFYQAAKAGKESDKEAGIQVELKSVEKIQEILDKGGRLLITKDGKVGMILESNGNAGGGFKNATAEGKNLLKPLLLTSIKLGARFTDAYDTFLPEYYAKFGFKPYKRIKFNPEFAESGWQDTILSSKPDIVVMYWDGGNREDIEKNYGKFPKYDKTQGEYTTDYEGAINEAREMSNSKEPQSSLIPNKTSKTESDVEVETTKKTEKPVEEITQEPVQEPIPEEESPKKNEREIIQEYVDMYDSMREEETTSKEKREMAEKMKQMLDENPNLKLIFDNIKNINKLLEAQGLITKTIGCP